MHQHLLYLLVLEVPFLKNMPEQQVRFAEHLTVALHHQNLVIQLIQRAMTKIKYLLFRAYQR